MHHSQAYTTTWYIGYSIMFLSSLISAMREDDLVGTWESLCPYMCIHEPHNGDPCIRYFLLTLLPLCQGHTESPLIPLYLGVYIIHQAWKQCSDTNLCEEDFYFSFLFLKAFPLWLEVISKANHFQVQKHLASLPVIIQCFSFSHAFVFLYPSQGRGRSAKIA